MMRLRRRPTPGTTSSKTDEAALVVAQLEDLAVRMDTVVERLQAEIERRRSIDGRQ